MTTIESQKWTAFANRFSREHDGWSASLQVTGSSGRREVEVDDRPFRGLTFEQHGGREALILSFGDDADEHLAHIIPEPRRLALLAADAEHCSLLVGLADGSDCVLELVSPLSEE